MSNTIKKLSDRKPVRRGTDGSPAVRASQPLLGEQVYRDLLAMLDGESLARDARLPSEPAMALRFKVSRPVLRQALARLRAEGRIYARKGSGNYVGASGAPIHAGTFGPLDNIPDVHRFLEFRCTLESESAACAAARREPQAVREIQLQRRRFELAIAAGRPGIEEDIAFHAAIANASGNRFYAITMAALAEQTRTAIRLVRALSGRLDPQRVGDVQREHAKIESAISAGHADAARAAMTAHLQGGIARLFGNYAATRPRA